MSKESTESKIDKLLGISNGIDDFLNDLSVDSVSEQFKNIDDNVKNAVEVLDNQISCYNAGDISSVDLNKIENSFSDIRELIDSSKLILKHIHSCIITTDLLDAEAIDSFSHLLEAAHLTIAEYINLYKNRLGFYDKIKLMTYKHLQDLEKMRIKHQYDVEMFDKKQDAGAVDAESTEHSFNFDTAIKALADESDDLTSMFESNNFEDNKQA